MEAATEIQKLQQVSEIQLSYSNPMAKNERFTIASSQDAYEILRPFYLDGQIELCERFFVAYLNKANEVLGVIELSKGGVAGTVVDMKILMATALKSLSSALVISHNHPSGTMSASRADMTMTQKIKEAAQLLDITLLDHLIITKESYYSMADDSII